MSYPSDWMQFNFLDDSQNEIPAPSTTTTTTAAAAATPINTNPALDHGRGSRPIRRRSRASRRTPTTLLNTDTTNFRAMVQQFTGSPTTTAASSSATRNHLNNTTGMLDFTQRFGGHVPSNLHPGGGVHVEYPNQMQQQHTFMVSDMHGRGGGGGGGSSRAPLESSSTDENSRGYNNYMF